MANKFLQRQHLNKQKVPDPSYSKTPDSDLDADSFASGIRALRQDLLLIELD